MENSFKRHERQLIEFVEVSHDGYAIFSAEDILVCANDAFLNVFISPEADMIGHSFSRIMRNAFLLQKGPLIDTEDIDSWLERVQSLRRSREFRLFEVDLVDGRWFLFSEQTLRSGEILIQAKDITKQKIVEQHLNERTRNLANLALTDELTQIANRRSLVASTNAEVARCYRQHLPMAFCLLDIDHFKVVNDTYGHQVGDQVLKQVANIIKSTLREYDIFGRIGGEEFAIFLAETNRVLAIEIADRLRSKVATQVLLIDGFEVYITLSVGIAHAQADTSFEQLYTSADAAFYEAKRSGRNKVIITETSSII